MDTTLYIATQHSIERAKERVGTNKRKAEKMIELALERGKDASAFSSMEKSYLEKVGLNGCTAIAYNNICYIVNENGTCVTLYPLPVWFGKKKLYNGKEKIRNLKKYSRNYENKFTSAYGEAYCE